MSRFSLIFPRPIPSAASMFQREGMLRHVCQATGYFVVDRLPMRNCRTTSNCRNRFQVLSADQSRCKLFRSLSSAIRYLETRAEVFSGIAG
jgi:hypothetical protein